MMPNGPKKEIARAEVRGMRNGRSTKNYSVATKICRLPGRAFRPIAVHFAALRRS
jgi:hypothetical protein